jgi:thioredoxin 1
MRAITGETSEGDGVQASRELPVLVDFWGPRCGPCLRLLPWVERLAERLAGRVQVVKVNAAENRRLCINLRVMGLPTFILYQDSQELERLAADRCTPELILAALRRLVPDLDAALPSPDAVA